MIRRLLLIPAWLSILATLIACGNGNMFDIIVKDYYSQTEKVTSEEKSMVHELVTISKMEERFFIAVNDKGDEYIIEDYEKYDKDFSVGKTIGVSYTEKRRNNDGTYDLSIINITDEGSLTIVPKEK